MSFSKELVVESGGGNYLKLPVGATKVRVVSDAVRFFKDFDGKKQYVTEEGAKTNPDAKVRYSMYVIDRADNTIKVWECSGAMIRDLQGLSTNPEFAFEDEFPYDIIITRVGSTLQDTRYTVGAARQNTALTEDEVKSIAELETMEMFLRGEAEDKDQVAPF